MNNSCVGKTLLLWAGNTSIYNNHFDHFCPKKSIFQYTFLQVVVIDSTYNIGRSSYTQQPFAISRFRLLLVLYCVSHFCPSTLKSIQIMPLVISQIRLHCTFLIFLRPDIRDITKGYTVFQFTCAWQLGSRLQNLLGRNLLIMTLKLIEYKKFYFSSVSSGIINHRSV